MSETDVVFLGIGVWIVTSIVLGLVLAKVIRLRNRDGKDDTE